MSPWLLVIALLLVNAFIPAISADEAYYISWAKDLAWGYFDHPPLVAWFSRLAPGSFFRIPFLVLSLLLVLLSKRHSLLWGLCIPGAHLFLGWALPDTVMIVVGFILISCFKRWNKDTSWLNTIVLGLSVGLLGLSKYHGFLLIIALAIGFWPKRKEVKLYAAIVLGAVVLMPHFIWQYHNDWPSFRYHLSDRFIPGGGIVAMIQFLVVSIILWLPMLWNYNYLPKWSRYLVVLSALVFGWSALNGSAELHWMLVLVWIIPELPRVINVKWRSLGAFLAVIHLLIFIPAISERIGIAEHFRKEIQSINELDHVIFLDSYQDAALYEMYTRKESYSLVHPGIRRSQYQLSTFPFQSKRVLIYNRMGMGTLVENSPFHKIEQEVHDLSGIEWTFNEGVLKLDLSLVPSGYRWIRYNYEDGFQVERIALGEGKELPSRLETNEMQQSYLTLEQNWVPSQLWIPLSE